MEFNLKKTLWSLLLAEGGPISPKKFQDFIHRSFPDRFLALSELKLAVEEINTDLNTREAPERIGESPDGYFIRLTPDYAELVRNYKGEPKPQKLTPAAMETLSIIAYRQPITRSQIESIRGVACDGPLGKLLELELVEGRPNETLPGRPMVYSTTNKFLEQCGLKSLDELPQTQDGENEKLKEFFRKQEESKEGEAADTNAEGQNEAPAEEAEAKVEAGENKA